MQHHPDHGGLPTARNVHLNQSHRFRTFMIEEILTDHQNRKVSCSPEETLKFQVQAMLSTRPYHNQFVLKADQNNVIKLPLYPLSCSFGSPLGSALFSRRPELQAISGPRYIESTHHSKLDPRLDGESKTKKGRRSRTVFTELQLVGLEKRFEKQKYLSTPDRIDLAESLGLSQLQVKTWYQNRRMKWKKIVLQGGGLESPTKPKGRPKKNSIPSNGGISGQERSREKNPGSYSFSNCDVNQEE